MKAVSIDFWNSNYYGHPPLTEEMIAVAESELGYKLPALLLELLRIQNGGYTKGFAYPMTIRTGWAQDHVPLPHLSGIITDKSFSTAFNILDSAYLSAEWGLPEKQVLLCGQGDWWITLDYRQGPVPSVRWIDVDCGEDIHVADSFESFFEGLVPEGDYA